MSVLNLKAPLRRAKILNLLQRDMSDYSAPLRGSRAYRTCHSVFCGNACHGHEYSCEVNSIIGWYQENCTVARGKGGPKGFQSQVSFVRCELDSEDKKDFAKFQTKPPMDFDSMLVEILQTNHKVGISFNETNDSFIVSITGKAEDCVNANRCYTSHAKTYVLALWIAVYKFHVIWKRGVWEEAEGDSDFG